MKIDWELPEIRAGWKGKIDTFIGPGATSAEKNIQLYPPILSILILIITAWQLDFGWTPGQYIVGSILMGDMVGGIITNSTSAAKRWFFREGEGFREVMSFIAIHILQIALASYFFLGFDLVWIALVYAYLMLACSLTLSAPLYLQRPLAGLLYAISLVLALYVWEIPAHLEWFLPMLFFKLLICHVLREEPYRPVTNTE
ncbi:hypothetical protein [Aliamphritea hakodatensis]|uniref:hypothetical protein n=1 Tax=Aliamphritea hakodatensis TaxID=2895352 RepID=UPI0022FD393D|nr:hypothetical protein [Aliamphritea hakodatensis]